MKFASLALVIIALLPSAYLAWSYRDMPHFGEGHDDALLFSSAKSLAEGRGYRVASLPGEPFQTKYPPVYPGLLAGVWWLVPDFPANLAPAMFVAWAALPLLMVVCWIYFSQLCAPIGLTLLVALNPYTVMFAMSLRTEILFTALLLTSLVALDRRPLLAGIIAGAAYVTRTAGIALVFAVVAIFLWRREYGKAWRFAAGVGPFAFAWTIWLRAHTTFTDDPHLLYYLDYVRFGLSNQEWTNIHLFMWKNAWAMLEGVGGLFLVEAGTSPVVRGILVVIAAAVVAGLIRSARIKELQPYLLFGVVYAGILLFWHFPPGERFLYPLLPLLLYGAVVELSRLARELRNSPQRGAAAVLGTCLFAGLTLIAWSQLDFNFKALPANMEAHRASAAATRAAFAWIDANVPDGENVLAHNDAVLHLYTGRHAMNMITPTRYYYEDRHDRMMDVQNGTVDFALQHGLEYILFDTRYRYVFTEAERASVYERIRLDPRVQSVYASDSVTVFRAINERRASP